MIRQRLTGLVATLGILLLLIGLPWLLLQVGFGALPTITNLADLIGLLLRRDDGTLALVVIKAIGWVTWALLAGMILLEVVAQLRGVRPPDLRGLGLPQTLARQLVATAAALFVALPANTVPAHADPTPAPAVAATVTVDNTQAAAPAPAPATPAPSTRPHTVQRGESLWSIAEKELGNGRRYTEIAALNTRLLDGKGDAFLKPGWTLNLPVDEPAVATSESASSYTVRKGDTLSEIALDHYGDAHAYPRIAAASRHITQPDGRHLTDPDVIDVGWTLAIPATPARAETPAPQGTMGRSVPPVPATPVDELHPTSPPAAEQPVPAAPAGTPAATAGSSAVQATPSASVQTPVERPTSSAAQSEATAVEPAWLLSGLAGGSLLAGSLWLALQRRRAAQFRSRRPGRMIATPPPQLAPVEKTLTAVGAAAAPDVEFIDGALRRLASRQGRANQPMPAVAAAECSDTFLRLHLADPADLPAPWVMAPDQLRWQLPTGVDLDAVGPLDAALPAPYPQLVTLGTDQDGHHWLYNLEEAGVVHVTGDPDYARDFIRHAAAELAVAPWTRDVRVEGVGLAGEAVALNPRRVSHHDTADVAADVIADTVAMIDRTREADLDIATGRATLLDDPLWESLILLVDSGLRSDLTGQLAELLNDHPRRTGTSLLVLADDSTPRPDGEADVINLTGDGRLRLSGVGITLNAAGLTAGEANGIAGIFGQADQPDVEMPDHDDTADGWRAHANQAGQLNPEHTLPRHSAADDAASVLPEDDDTYLDVAASTPADLATLAPQVPDTIRDRVARADPTLDDDLRTWFDPQCDLPRLLTLGPLTVRVAATGKPTEAAARRPFLTELLAYLATRPQGATTEEVADALRMPLGRVRKDVATVRAWLGPNPRTGRSHLPDNRHTEAAKIRGRGAYQVEDLLVDADLFRRLRVRGEARGPDGLDDLKRALSLVTGTPYSQLRDNGGAWLADTGRLDQILQCAIIDVAHLVTTACLADGDLAGAHAAAELAATVAPAEETAHLDLIAVLAAHGHHQVAEQMLRDRVWDRSDDEDDIPTELPPRTEEILDKQAWLTRRNAKASA